MVFVFLCLPSLRMIVSRSMQVAANFMIFLWLSNIPLYVYVCVYIYTPPPYLLYPVLCLQTFRLIPCLGCCKWCCNEHWGKQSLWEVKE